MKPISFSMKGTEYALTLKVSTYPEGNLAIKLYQESFGQLVFWDSLTVNLGGDVYKRQVYGGCSATAGWPGSGL